LVDELPSGSVTVLDGAEGRHAATVRRLGPGERVHLADGAGGLAECEVVSAEADALQLRVLSRSALDPPQPAVVVVQALPKGDRGTLAVELLTELGVDEIVPWAAARCIAQWRGERGAKALAHWRSAARAAAKQSRRPWVPRVRELASTRDVCGILAGASGALVLHEEGRRSLAEAELPAAGVLALVVGPEGGLTEGELTAFRAARASVVRLGAPVLRTSTAGAAALAALSPRLGRWA
jgi:16S rRNA (uracil1498-N3)-methyltransferase